MSELWACAPDVIKRKFRELYAADQSGVNRKLKELWARDNAAVNRKIFSGGIPISFSQYLQFNCYPTFVPTINGQTYKLSITTSSSYPSSCGATFSSEINSALIQGQETLYVPATQLHNLPGNSILSLKFVVRVENSSGHFPINDVTDMGSLSGDYTIPARSLSAAVAVNGPYTITFLFAGDNYINLNNTSFEIDVSKMVWLPTGENFQLQ